MSKWIAFIVALTCMLLLIGCKQETHMEIGNAASLSVHSGLRGDSALVTDPEAISYITENLNAIAFDKGKSSLAANGFDYSLRWYDENMKLITDLEIMDETTISYEDHYYNAMKADDKIDVDYLRALLDKQYEEPRPDAPADTWGVTMTAENVTFTGLTLVIRHSGVKLDGQLETGSPYWVEVRNGDVWNLVPELPVENGIERGWTMEAYLIPMNGSYEKEVHFEWLYGELPAGQYRIGKEIRLFRGTGDYDEQIYYAEFSIT